MGGRLRRGWDVETASFGPWKDDQTGLFIEHYPIRGVYLIGFKPRAYHCQVKPAVQYINMSNPEPRLVELMDDATVFETELLAANALSDFRKVWGEEMCKRIAVKYEPERGFGTVQDNARYKEQIIAEYVATQKGGRDWSTLISGACGVAIGLSAGFVMFYRGW